MILKLLLKAQISSVNIGDLIDKHILFNTILLVSSGYIFDNGISLLLITLTNLYLVLTFCIILFFSYNLYFIYNMYIIFF